MALTNTEQGGKDFLLKRGNGFSGAVTFQTSDNTVTKTAHGLINGQKVKFSDVTTTTLDEDTEFFVIDAAADTFKLAATLGGSAITIDANGTGVAEEVFETVGGIRSRSISINGEVVDITSEDSDQWKKLLDGAGINSASLSGSGVFADSVGFKLARTDKLNRRMKTWRIYTNTDGDYYSGTFMITSLEQAAEYNTESTFSISLESSGEVTYTEAA